ncbi:hypothetical protein EVAR_47004_1 [Eumeta japonica]|uniref:Uncharacterized protein n=1 Tax=Eumeta variegata TaxID=151549 RepID=A0A4C1X5A8_EUMVA|nr:hypothetical protein EVAR_47004_1 [Eumeta japonica]
MKRSRRNLGEKHSRRSILCTETLLKGLKGGDRRASADRGRPGIIPCVGYDFSSVNKGELDKGLAGRTGLSGCRRTIYLIENETENGSKRGLRSELKAEVRPDSKSEAESEMEARLEWELNIRPELERIVGPEVIRE